MIVNKPYTEEQYAELAIFCNENGLVIEDKGDYLESVLPPEPTEEEQKNIIRQVRNSYLVDFVDPYQLVIRWGELSETEQSYMKEYRQYLLDYTKEDGWWKDEPLNYTDWLVAYHPVTEV